MKTITDDGPFYEKLVNEIRKVYDKGKYVKLSPSTFN